AKLGGFLGRKSDGDPGWLTLWRGWQTLQLLLHGVHLADGLTCG
ncbi:MAG TPA: IS4 family transposase, partial [Ktedonobacteraceae bacterium]|nr:IS4 family transposase [Ktedonobacteraceae bacterium]HZO73606.1 IS4 family transposase [Ktedonobacteraceae bacterium]